ncbi:MAG: ATP-dependent RNA helicase HrpA [Candidatus Brocadiaceae bacterium]|nr:ATP-dependent RNA helicase HrpA [Candidatus Brocadiaceae bacterium]
MHQTDLNSLPRLEKLKKLIGSVMLRDRWKLQKQLRLLEKQKEKNKKWDKDILHLYDRARASFAFRENQLKDCPQISFPEDLPIVQHREEIVAAIQKHQALIIAGETGSGKTTQLPKLCVVAGQGQAAKIGCTQPRRIAATSVAQRIADELDTVLGTTVGYKIRFFEKTSNKTIIQMMTDGILLTEIQRDRFLNDYDTIIIDEAHERSLNIDFLLGYLKRLLPKRPELKLIISSASLDIPRFSEAFPDAPVIEVSGRVFPVEVRYKPIDKELEEQGDVTIEDAVVQTVGTLLKNSREGNILVFMPGEQEIREVVGRLDSSRQSVAVLPLFGRMSYHEQNRIFQNMSQRKVIVATNIAETSLTIPGIRYVIDTGLARLSRYSTRSHTLRLPVESISRSSANQRKGRAGRVEAGVCIRLYSEEDYLQRPEFTPPEIVRSSLADVILRMKYQRLGDIEAFPFIDSPSSAAIRSGIKLLKELGALDEANEITSLGREMAHLPIEPRTARMLLAAKQENVLREMLVIAAGISIQDPREYPLDKIEQAKQCHSVFVDCTSDFITLLNIWNAYHEQWESLKTENKMRKFCKTHFLSFARMREWRDIHRQLMNMLKESSGFRLKKEPADYRGIHICILAGYLSQIGLKKQKNLYQTAANREMMLFPGSGVFNKGKSWIVASELVETSRLFARRVANIEVDWLEEIGKNLCKRSYSEASYHEKTQSVVAYEKVTLYGLVIVPRRQVYYGKINHEEATAIFIQEALVEGKLRTSHPFFKHNQDVKERIMQKGAKLRRCYDTEIKQAMGNFYSERLCHVASAHDLNGLLMKKSKKEKAEFLYMTEKDFSIIFEESSLEAFPDNWNLGDHLLPLDYHFNPEKKKDGVTLRVEEKMLPYLDANSLDWLVPGLWEEKILYLLKGLPKRIRKQLVPIPQTAKIISQNITHTHPWFLEALSEHLRCHHGVSVSPDEWDEDRVPSYLKVRLEIEDYQHKVIAQGRNAEAILKEGKKLLEEKSHADESSLELSQWRQASNEWELHNLSDWSFDELPRKIMLETPSGIPLYGYPGLKVDDEGEIHRCLFHKKEEALSATKEGIKQLVLLQVGYEIAWLERDFQDLKEFEEHYKIFGSLDQLRKYARENLYRYLFEVLWIDNRKNYENHLALVKNKLDGLMANFKKCLGDILRQYHETKHDFDRFLKRRSFDEAYQELTSQLHELMPQNFLKTIPYAQLRHVSRYLKAMSIRAERLALDPRKDQAKKEKLAPYLNEWKRLYENTSLSESQQLAIHEFYWMLEEYKVSLFAGELRTAMPVSAKRLDSFLEKFSVVCALKKDNRK